MAQVVLQQKWHVISPQQWHWQRSGVNMTALLTRAVTPACHLRAILQCMISTGTRLIADLSAILLATHASVEDLGSGILIILVAS